MSGYWNFYVRRNPHILAKVLLDSEFMHLKEYCEDTEWCTLVEVLTYTYQCSLISKICICFTILATNFPAVLKHSTKYSNSKTPQSRPSSWWGTATNGFVATRRVNAPPIASKWADVSHSVVVNICYDSDSTTRSSNNDYQSVAAMISGLSCLCARTVAIWLSSAIIDYLRRILGCSHNFRRSQRWSSEVQIWSSVLLNRCLPDSLKPDSPKLGLGFRVRVSVSANRDWTVQRDVKCKF